MKKISFLMASLMLLSTSMLHAQYNNYAEGDSVGPLLGNIMYDQSYPYNNKCPYLGDGGRSLTGCVATAMAQIMRYYQYPDVGEGTANYTSSSGANTYVYSQHPFDWNNMLENYSVVSSTAAQDAAVAELMLACGASVNMNYSASGSGSRLQKAFGALKNNFKYYDVEFASCEGEPDEGTTEDYIWVFVDEFKKGHPILYASCPTSNSGHAFVLDGYKVRNGKVYLHVNWGWSGANNGWFEYHKLTSDPKNQPSYSYDVEFVYNFAPRNWTGVEETPENATGEHKFIRNGQIVIEKNGTLYNVLGAEIE